MANVRRQWTSRDSVAVEEADASEGQGSHFKAIAFGRTARTKAAASSLGYAEIDARMFPGVPKGNVARVGHIDRRIEPPGDTPDSRGRSRYFSVQETAGNSLEYMDFIESAA